MATTIEDLSAMIADDIAKALATKHDEDRLHQLRTLAATTYAMAYDDAGGTGSSAQGASNYVKTLNEALNLLERDGTEAQQERMASIIAQSALNAATVDVNKGSDVEWRTMRDDKVRDTHVPLDGQVRAAGEPFDIAGTPTMYPGQPVGPPENWINCRCRLLPASRTASVDESLVAREFNTAKRKELADKGHAMPDGSFPISNEEDLRNAIQAIGRAKDPDAVKRHIRKRARALGLTDLIPESWTASLEADAALTAWAPSTSPPGTHDAPGWVTNPKETQRLRTYWTKGEGAAKIRWGQPGDFDRCRKQLAKYVPNPTYLAGTCANLHFVALGYWPNAGPHKGKHGHTAAGECDECRDFDPDNTTPEGAAVTAAFAAAAVEDALPPREWFADPAFDGPTAMTVTDDGEVLGHAALWATCHVGYKDTCVPPPHSTRDYAHFRTGYVRTAAGNVAVGHLTLGTGHADEGIGAAATIEHYDNTGTVVADVAAGEDEHGIWVHGMMRPGTTPEQAHALRAGVISGDWRNIGGNLEMVAALIVNVPGFPVPRPSETLAASGDPISLVAAGMVVADPNAVSADAVALAVIARLDERERNRTNLVRVNTVRTLINADRVAQLVAAVGGIK